MIPQAELDQRAEFLAAMPRHVLGYDIVEVRAWIPLDGNPFGSSKALVILRHDGAPRDVVEGPYQTGILSWHRNPEGGLCCTEHLCHTEHHHPTLEDAQKHARERAEDERMYLLLCEWYPNCDNYADGAVAHPVLGMVPTCERCATKHSMTLIPFGVQA